MHNFLIVFRTLLVMKTTTTDTVSDAKLVKTRAHRLLPDGKWCAFPKSSKLGSIRHNGVYFGRAKIEGKIFRESLGTDIFSTAKLLLGD